MPTFSGFGPTFEDAFQAAAEEAMSGWKPGTPDDMATLRVVESTALYGGFPGFTGVRRVEVERTSFADKSRGVQATEAAELVLQLEAVPAVVYLNRFPGPDPNRDAGKVALLLSVTNIGNAKYEGQSPDLLLARFAILHGRTVLWKTEANAGSTVTPITINPRETKVFQEVGLIPNDPNLEGAELHAVGRFVPSGDSARTKIRVRVAQ